MGGGVGRGKLEGGSWKVVVERWWLKYFKSINNFNCIAPKQALEAPPFSH